MNLVLFLSAAFMMSCEKKEKAIVLPPKGDGTVMQVDMGETYQYQYYISLRNEKVVYISGITNWDLAFSSSPDRHTVALNGAKLMSAYNTHKTDFAAVGPADTLDLGLRWDYDEASGLIDSTSIGEWKQKNEIYLVRLNNNGNKVRKIRFVSEDAFQYVIEVGDLGTQVPVQLSITKNKDQNFTYFSFDFLTTVEGVEPHKSSWDIQVTLYNFTFFDQNPPLPYVVNGVLLNPNGVSAYKDSLGDYNTMDMGFATSVPLSYKRDVIGFDWKKYDIDKNLYTVDKRYSYIIRNADDNYFKLRFLDFYSANGVKGSPKFEFKRLQ